jgi:hypothetical protein
MRIILFLRSSRRLRDNSTQVRKNTIMVLTHLILNDMVKVKGQISELAICIVDNNDQLAGLAKAFFTELANKVGHIYTKFFSKSNCYIRVRKHSWNSWNLKNLVKGP